MAKAALITNNGLKRIYRSAKGQVVRLEMSDDWTEIKFIDVASDKKFGEFEFKDLENGTYQLMRAYTEPNKGGGIGRAALEMFKEITDSDIVSSPNDGQVREDGSHLTQDAPGFVKKMIAEGLIAGYEDSMGHNDDGFID